MTAAVASPRWHWTAVDLLAAEFPPPRWAIPGLVAEGVTLLAGPPKVGKSWLALDLAVAVASGGFALGQQVSRGDVLYLALEDTARRLADRLRLVLAGDSAPDKLQFATAWRVLAEGGTENLNQWLNEHPGARLVVIDVFERVRSRSTSGNAYADDYGPVSRLKALADKHSVAILVVHHTRKMPADDFLEEVSGTNGLAGAADAVLLLKRSRGSADAELHVTGRDINESAHAMKFDGARGQWSMLAGPATDYSLADTRRQILTYLRTAKGSTPQQIATALGLDSTLVRKTVRRMFDDGQLDTIGQGRYVPPHPVTPVTGVTQSHPPDSDSSDNCDTPTGAAQTGNRP